MNLPSPFDQSDSVSIGAEAHLPEPLPSDPFLFFKGWFDEAVQGRVSPNPNAFSLATIDPDGRPSSRIVLCKQMDPAAGHIVFYTNYDGRKGRALRAHPFAAAVFHWDTLDRQARLEGPVTPSPASESDAYFQSRPWISRIGAWASAQGEPIPSRGALKERVDQTMRRFGIDPARPPARDAAVEIPRPPNWGGFRLLADRIELWVGATGRLHDRAAWKRSGSSPWVATRLQP